MGLPGLAKMSSSKELLRISRTTRIISDHLNFLHELEEKETKYGPSELPRPKLKDRQNSLEMCPLDFRIIFGMSREAFKELLSMIEPQLRRERDGCNGNLLPIHRLLPYSWAIFFHLSRFTWFVLHFKMLLSLNNFANNSLSYSDAILSK